MKDLKHLYEFEKLLQEANNELVQKAKADGGIALGYTCYHIPEVLLNLGNCFSVRLRAPDIADTAIAAYYMSEKNCMYSQSILELAIEGGYNFFSALLSAGVLTPLQFLTICLTTSIFLRTIRKRLSGALLSFGSRLLCAVIL